jgi:Na+-driven multidrug efflux pump
MVPVIFGIGASMIAIIGAYVGAGQRQQAISIAWRGIGVNVALIGLLGLFLSIFPQSWCSIVGSDPSVIANCSQSLRIIAPTYAFFALGLSCYLASQALNTLNFPVIGALLRLLVAATGLYWISQTTPINYALYLVAAAAVIYGIVVAVGLRFGPWRRQ